MNPAKSLPENLLQENRNFKLKIRLTELELKKLDNYRKFNNLGFNKGDFIYLEYMKNVHNKTEPFSNLGFIIKETINHLKFIVYDRKRNAAHKYLVHKDQIRGIKHYEGDSSSIIKFEELLKLWRNKK